MKIYSKTFITVNDLSENSEIIKEIWRQEVTILGLKFIKKSYFNANKELKKRFKGFSK